MYDLEMLEATGSCAGIENYSRWLTGRAPGEPPPTFFEYIPDNALLFVDEIHRFNRAQQDGFLPFVEEGIVTLVGTSPNVIVSKVRRICSATSSVLMVPKSRCALPAWRAARLPHSSTTQPTTHR